MMGRLVLLWLCAAAMACAALARAADEAVMSSTSDATAAGRQILVMLHLAPPRFRPEADYAGSYDARFGERARRKLAEELASRHRLKVVGEWPMPSLGVDCFVMEVSGGDVAVAIAEALARDARVESAQPVQLFHALAHDDPLYSLQPAAREWHLSELHAVTTGRNAVVAEIDSGVDSAHPDLAGQIPLARNFVDGSPYAAEIHGTAVAGIIAARADNGIGIVGIAPNAKLLALRACWQTTRDASGALCSSFTLAKAMQFAISRKPNVINLSVGGPPDRLLGRLVAAAVADGITVVGADDPAGGATLATSDAPLLRVASDDGMKAGPDVFVAPGRDVPSTVPDARWNFVSGSSYAAAHVSGVVALLHELSPGIRPAAVRDALRATRFGIPAASAGSALHVDACAVVERIVKSGVCATPREARTSMVTAVH